MKPYFEAKGVTIYHGDCRLLLPNMTAFDLCLTDPPYGVGAKYGAAYSDAREGYWDWFVPVVGLLREHAAVVAMTHRVAALRELRDWDWCAVWHKPYGAGARVGNSPLLPHWEPILLWGIHALGPRRDALPDVLTFNPQARGAGPGVGRERLSQDAAGHPFPKPVSLFTRICRGLTSEGQRVVDPFCGTGTTLIAARDCGREAVGIEIEERYCETAAKRLSQSVMF